MMEHAGVVAELHVITVNCFAASILLKQFSRVEDLGDEHRSLALGCWRKKVQVLPNGATNRAWDADIVLESRETARDSLGNELCHHCPTLNPKPAIIVELEVTRSVPNHQAAEAFVADQNVGAKTEHEKGYTQLTSGIDSHCQIIGRCGIVEVVSWTTDLECGVLSKRLIPFEPLCVESIGQFPVNLGAHFHSI